MVSSVRKGYIKQGFPFTKRYVWPKPTSTVRYCYLYMLGNEQRFFNSTIADEGPNQAVMNLGWKPIVKVRVTLKKGSF